MSPPSDRSSGARPSIGVVVPAYNAVSTLADCLAAIGAMAPPAAEIIVVDDGSTDGTRAIAEASGARVLHTADGPRGPALARNIGAAALRSDYVLFVDADVIIRPDAPGLLIDDLLAHGAVAAFGSYDDAPRSQRATSLYANLRHHYIHGHGRRDAATFWSGIGLMHRGAFLAAGGFDQQRYARPSIEDVELGARMIRAGHAIRLVPEAQGKHCKDWRAVNIWRTDIFSRAYPWTQLIARGEGPSGDLNLAKAERMKAIAAIAVLLFLIAGLVRPAALWGSVAAMAIYLALNVHFLAYLTRRTRPWALVVATAMHWLYHVYALVTYVATMAWMSVTRAGRTQMPAHHNPLVTEVDGAG